MEEYVAKSILKKELNISNLHSGIIDALQNIVDEIPAADVQEVKHGHWIVDPDEGTAWCSSCRVVFEDNGDTIPDYWYYCPHCGAKMDGKENNK